jgi:hypothetical protein
MPNVQMHAHNLVNPSHMEWSADGKLLVSERTTGCIKDVTRGGDMADSKPFAWGLKGPASILPTNDGRLLVSETWSDSIKDMAGGGDMSKQKALVTGLSNPYGLSKLTEKNGSERFFVVESYNSRSAWVTEFSLDGTIKGKHVKNIPATPYLPGLTPSSAWPTDWGWQKIAGPGCGSWTTNAMVNGVERLLLAVGDLGQIIDITDGGDFPDLIENKKAIAWDMGNIGAIKYNRKKGMVYAAEPARGSVMAIDPDKPENQRFKPPIVRGLNNPTCERFSENEEVMFVCGQGDGVVWRIEDF